MKGKIANYVLGVMLIAFGLFMILNPAAVINIAAFVFSLGLVVRGASALRGMIRFNKEAKKLELSGDLDSVRKTMLTNTLLSFGVGILALIVSVVSLINGSGGIMKASVYIIAFGFFASGILGMVENRAFKAYDGLGDAFNDKSFVYLLVALILFVFPFLVGSIVIFILGGVIILMGVGIIAFEAKATKVVVTKKDAEAEYTEIKEEDDK